jgi:hypothetical protein
MAEYVTEVGKYVNISASALVRTGACDLLGIFCASSAGATVLVYDQTSAAVPIVVNTFTAIAGTFYPIPAHCGNGIYITIAGTGDITVFFKPRV